MAGASSATMYSSNEVVAQPPGMFKAFRATTRQTMNMNTLRFGQMGGA